MTAHTADEIVKAKTQAKRLVVSIDAEELAVRLAETVLRARRPLGKSPRECLAFMSGGHGALWLAAACAAMEYLRECIDTGERPS